MGDSKDGVRDTNDTKSLTDVWTLATQEILTCSKDLRPPALPTAVMSSSTAFCTSWGNTESGSTTQHLETSGTILTDSDLILMADIFSHDLTLMLM